MANDKPSPALLTDLSKDLRKYAGRAEMWMEALPKSAPSGGRSATGKSATYSLPTFSISCPKTSSSGARWLKKCRRIIRNYRPGAAPLLQGGAARRLPPSPSLRPKLKASVMQQMLFKLAKLQSGDDTIPCHPTCTQLHKYLTTLRFIRPLLLTQPLKSFVDRPQNSVTPN